MRHTTYTIAIIEDNENGSIIHFREGKTIWHAKKAQGRAKVEQAIASANGSNSDKMKSLDEAVLRMEKTFGKGSIMRLGERTHMQVDTTPTGSLSLGCSAGRRFAARSHGGNLRCGRRRQNYAGFGTASPKCRKSGGICAFIDAEHALDPKYAKTLGVDIDNLFISQPDNGEQALEIADTLVRSGAIDMVIIDSVAALTPRAEIEGEMGDLQVGAMARMMSQGCRKLASSVGRANATASFHQPDS